MTSTEQEAAVSADVDTTTPHADPVVPAPPDPPAASDPKDVWQKFAANLGDENAYGKTKKALQAEYGPKAAAFEDAAQAVLVVPADRFVHAVEFRHDGETVTVTDTGYSVPGDEAYGFIAAAATAGLALKIKE